MTEPLRIMLSPGGVAVGASADAAGWREPVAIEALDAEAWARLRGHAGGVAQVVLDAADIHVVTTGPATSRRGVARALQGVSPVMLRRVRWGWRAAGDAVRVAMAHRDHVDAVVATFARHGIAATVLAGDIVLDVPSPPSPFWMLAAIPLLTAVAAWGMAVAGEARIAASRPAATAAMRARGEAARIDAVFGRIGAGETLARLARVLPADATLNRVVRDGAGGLTVEIDMADPAGLPAAMARDPVLGGLRMVTQMRIPDRGFRIRMRAAA